MIQQSEPAVYWALARGAIRNNADSAEYLMKSRSDENLDYTTSYEDLSKALRILQPGSYTLMARKSPKQSKGNLYMRLDLNQSAGASKEPIQGYTYPGAIPGIGSLDQLITEKVEAAKQEIRHQFETESLKKEIQELKEGGPKTSFERMLETMAPVVKEAILKKQGAQVALSGYNNQAPDPTLDEDGPGSPGAAPLSNTGEPELSDTDKKLVHCLQIIQKLENCDTAAAVELLHRILSQLQDSPETWALVKSQLT